MLTECFSQALYLALQAHTNQKRKGTNIPYISHPLGVASIALEYGADEDQAIICPHLDNDGTADTDDGTDDIDDGRKDTSFASEAIEEESPTDNTKMVT